MKVLKEKYPIGTLKGQQTAGRYIDGYFYENLNIMADKISKDMTFLMFVFSSTLEVGTGKSVFTSQVGEVWTEMINRKYGLNNTFNMQNCTFKPKDLIERSFKLPKYSCIILDEWEDQHYMSQLGMTLRQFFRKCRQLNLFMICIIPNFFQLNLGYAVSRSIAAVDVKFEGDLERGFFDFYNFKSKKELYIKGKKFHNYDSARASFSGRFTDGYGFDEKEYRAAKLRDMIESDEEESLDPKKIERKAIIRTFGNVYTHLNKEYDFSIPKVAKAFGIHSRTGDRYLAIYRGEEKEGDFEESRKSLAIARATE